MGEFRDPYREAMRPAVTSPSNQPSPWMAPIWIVVIVVQLIVGVLLSTDAWVAIQPNPHRPVGIWHGEHPAWIFVAALITGLLGGASGMRPWFIGATAYIGPAVLLLLFMLPWVDIRNLALGGVGASMAFVGAGLGFRLIGRRLPRVEIIGGCCTECGYLLEGIPADAPCPECGTTTRAAKSEPA